MEINYNKTKNKKMWGQHRTHLQGHRAHSNVGHQEQQIRQAETHQEFVEHRKHYLEKQWMVKENND